MAGALSAGLGLLSYLGTFEGIGVLPFGWDILVVCLFSTAIFRLAVRSRLHGPSSPSVWSASARWRCARGGSALNALFEADDLAAHKLESRRA